MGIVIVIAMLELVVIGILAFFLVMGKRSMDKIMTNEDSGRRGKVKAIVFDKNQEIFENIKKGIIAATIDHDAFTQGYYPIVLMYNHLVAGMELNHERIMCKASVVDEENIDEHIDI